MAEEETAGGGVGTATTGRGILIDFVFGTETVVFEGGGATNDDGDDERATETSSFL